MIMLKSNLTSECDVDCGRNVESVWTSVAAEVGLCLDVGCSKNRYSRDARVSLKMNGARCVFSAVPNLVCTQPYCTCQSSCTCRTRTHTVGVPYDTVVLFSVKKEKWCRESLRTTIFEIQTPPRGWVSWTWTIIELKGPILGKIHLINDF